MSELVPFSNCICGRLLKQDMVNELTLFFYIFCKICFQNKLLYVVTSINLSLRRDHLKVLWCVLGSNIFICLLEILMCFCKFVIYWISYLFINSNFIFISFNVKWYVVVLIELCFIVTWCSDLKSIDIVRFPYSRYCPVRGSINCHDFILVKGVSVVWEDMMFINDHWSRLLSDVGLCGYWNKAPSRG